MPSLSKEQDLFQTDWLAQMPVALTVLDTQGRLLFYNDQAAKLLDRQPSYLGRPVQELHQAASAAKIDAILAAFAQGQWQEHAWTFARPGGRAFAIRVCPWVVDGQLRGLLHVAAPLS